MSRTGVIMDRQSHIARNTDLARPSVCLSVSLSRTGYWLANRRIGNQNWSERSPGQMWPVYQFSDQTVKGYVLLGLELRLAVYS